jgi:hypothetical protein
MQVMMAIMELSRGHPESVYEVGAPRRDLAGKDRLAATDGIPLTARVPSWLRVDDEKWEIVEDAAAPNGSEIGLSLLEMST